jgi:hypothetical protein
MTTETLTEATTPTPPATSPPTVQELDLAWAAVRAGRFRADAPTRQVRQDAPATAGPTGLVVTVVGAHGWSGTSTTALLLAETAARAGAQVRLIDAADPISSGLVGAAVTEHGCDESGQWRCGTRGAAVGSGQLRLERLAERPAEPAAVPAAAAPGTATLTVVDAGWPLAELLGLAGRRAERRHWLGQLIHGSALVLTARASVPGVQRLAAAATLMDSVRNLDQALAIALVGAHRLPRLRADVVAACLPAATDPGQVVLLPGRRDFAVQGVTSSDLPRQLTPAGARLLRATGYRPGTGPEPSGRGLRRARGEQ